MSFGQVISPEDLPKGLRFYCLTNQKEDHQGFQFRTGLNVDARECNVIESDELEGLDFVNEIQLLNYRKLGHTVWIREVSFPKEETIIYIDKGKYKANQMILRETEVVVSPGLY